MTRYRKNLYKAQLVVFSILGFWGLSIYSLDYMERRNKFENPRNEHELALYVFNCEKLTYWNTRC
jgi:hypothetical protein